MLDLLQALAIAIVLLRFCYLRTFVNIFLLNSLILLPVRPIYFLLSRVVSYKLFTFCSIYSIAFLPSSNSYLYLSRELLNSLSISANFF